MTCGAFIRFQNRRAFTIIELLVVIAIIAILTAMLLPALASATSPGAINIGYADGHVGPVKLSNLYNQYWHKDYVPPATIPPPQ